MCKTLGVVGDLRPVRRVEVVSHTVVEGEHRGGSTNLGTHVTDGSHTRARKRLHARAIILNNGTSSALDRENTDDLEDDICICASAF